MKIPPQIIYEIDQDAYEAAKKRFQNVNLPDYAGPWQEGYRQCLTDTYVKFMDQPADGLALAIRKFANIDTSQDVMMPVGSRPVLRLEKIPRGESVNIPEEIEDWISDWLKKNIISDPNDYALHNTKVVWARSIALALYHHLQDRKATDVPDTNVGDMPKMPRWTPISRETNPKKFGKYVVHVRKIPAITGEPMDKYVIRWDGQYWIVPDELSRQVYDGIKFELVEWLDETNVPTK